MGQLLRFPVQSNPASRPAAPSQQMVTAALKSWMDGDPLTEREQRIVDTVIDTNYFGQIGRLAMGC